ncbi:hypothetical protein QJQ45_007794 [Haematococcus lacustris]|nr:hypothetical protein QJQ45_007794 [Haematococcus lacustris]
MTDTTPNGETPGAGSAGGPAGSQAILAQALSDREFARSLRAALFPDGFPAATPPRNGQGDGPVPPGDEEDEEEEQDEEEEVDDVSEGEIDLSSADQLAQSLLDTQDQLKEAKTELAKMKSRQKLTDRTLAALAEKVNSQAPAAKSVPGPDKWTDNCTKSRRRASAFCDDLEAHCLRFNLDIASVFPAFLSGAARDAWLPSIRAAHFAQTRTAPTWPYLRMSFLEYTGDDLRDDQTDAQKQLLEGSIRMSSQLLLNEYVTAFRNNLLTAGVQCMEESLLVSLFIKGLTSELKKAVLRDSAPFPAFTLAQAIDSARQAQRAAEILAEAVGTKRHVAAVQAKQLTEGLERASNPRPPKSTQSDPPAKVPARSRGFRAGMAAGPAAGYRVILKQKAEEAAEQSNMKPGQYCHHCYDPRHLKPLCPYKDMPALEARKLSGYPRPPADAKAAGKRPSEHNDSEPKKGRIASANGKFDVANNQPVICEHYVKVQLRINSFCCMCLLTVMPDMVHAYDVLLGADWLTVQGALVDYVDKTLTLRTPQGGQQLAEEEELLDEFGLDQFDSTSTPVDELNAQIATLQAQLVAAQANNQQAGSLVSPLAAKRAANAALLSASPSPAKRPVEVASQLVRPLAAALRALQHLTAAMHQPVAKKDVASGSPGTSNPRTLAAVRDKYAGVRPTAAPLPANANAVAGPDSNSRRGLPVTERWTDASSTSGRRALSFLEDLEAHCVAHGLDPALALPSFLSGKARDVWFQSVRDSYALTYSGYPTWHYLSKQFLEFVGEDLTTDADAARAKLLDSTHLRMTNGVALSAYITDFRNTLTLAGKDCMTDSMLVNVFQRGLSADLRGPVAKDLRALVAPTLDEAIKAAITNHKALVAAAGSGVHPASRRPVAAVHQVAQVQRGLQNLARFPGPPPGRPAAPSADSEGPPPASGYCYHCGLSSHWTKHCKRKASGMSKEEAMKDAGTWELMQDLKKGGSAPYKAAKRDRSPDRGGDHAGPSRRYQGRRPQTARMEANGMVKHFQKYQRK